MASGADSLQNYQLLEFNRIPTLDGWSQEFPTHLHNPETLVQWNVWHLTYRGLTAYANCDFLQQHILVHITIMMPDACDIYSSVSWLIQITVIHNQFVITTQVSSEYYYAGYNPRDEASRNCMRNVYTQLSLAIVATLQNAQLLRCYPTLLPLRNDKAVCIT